MKAIRLKEIENYMKLHQMASFETLAEAFDVSINTVRRDIAQLTTDGVLRKIHGGVAYEEHNEDTVAFQLRSIKLPEEKKSIGKLAASLISEGDIIFVDSGTTTLQLMPYIKDMRVTILTNNLNLVTMASGSPNIDLICTGGKLYNKTSSFIGMQAIQCIRAFNIQKAFMAATGLSIRSGCTNSSSLENEIKRAVVEMSERVYLMADHSKYDVVSLMTFCGLSDLSGFVTDAPPPQMYKEFFEKNNIPCLY